MTEQTSNLRDSAGKCPLSNWVEEGAVAALDENSKSYIQRHGHKDIIADQDQNVKMEIVTTSRAIYVSPQYPAVRLKGSRSELLEKHLTQKIREEVLAELEPPPPPETEFSSTTQKDFCAQGFVSCRPCTTNGHDYKTDQAITFWSENYQKIQGVTPVRNPKTAFRKLTLFSTPITQRLDEIDFPPDN